MSAFQRFAIGGLGGLLPLIVSFLSFDPATVITYLDTLPPGVYVGYLIKTIVLFALGGTLAALSESATPWTLVQLGIAAPALITSYINGAAVSGPTESGRQATSSIAVISSAYAAEASGHVPIVSVNFLGDVVRGATVPLPKIRRELQEQERPQPRKPPEQPHSPPATR
jgi:hypothetical protein